MITLGSLGFTFDDFNFDVVHEGHQMAPEPQDIADMANKILLAKLEKCEMVYYCRGYGWQDVEALRSFTASESARLVCIESTVSEER